MGHLKMAQQWEKFFKILETYSDESSLSRFLSKYMFSDIPDDRRVNIKKYFDFCKKSGSLNGVSASDLEEFWNVMSGSIGEPFYYPTPIVAAVGGKNAYGGAKGTEKFNVIALSGEIDLEKIRVSSKLTPFYERFKHISLAEIKQKMSESKL